MCFFYSGPPPPTNLQVIDIEATQLTIQWVDEYTSSTNPVTRYQLFVNDKRNRNVNRINATTQQATLVKLGSNNLHNIKVRSLTSTTNIRSDFSGSIPGVTGKMSAYNDKQFIAAN